MKHKVKNRDIEEALAPVIVEFMARFNIPLDSVPFVIEFIKRFMQVFNDEGYVIVPRDVFKENK